MKKIILLFCYVVFFITPVTHAQFTSHNTTKMLLTQNYLPPGISYKSIQKDFVKEPTDTPVRSQYSQENASVDQSQVSKDVTYLDSQLRGGFSYWFRNVDEEKINFIFSNANAEYRKALQSSYQQQTGRSLLNDLTNVDTFVAGDQTTQSQALLRLGITPDVLKSLSQQTGINQGVLLQDINRVGYTEAVKPLTAPNGTFRAPLANAPAVCGPSNGSGYRLCVSIPGSTGYVNDLAEYIKIIFQFLIGLAGIVAFARIVWGGIAYTLSAGNIFNQNEARQIITSALLGLALLLGSLAVLYAINPDLLRLGPQLNALEGVDVREAQRLNADIKHLNALEDAKRLGVISAANAKLFQQHHLEILRRELELSKTDLTLYQKELNALSPKLLGSQQNTALYNLNYAEQSLYDLESFPDTPNYTQLHQDLENTIISESARLEEINTLAESLSTQNIQRQREQQKRFEQIQTNSTQEQQTPRNILQEQKIRDTLNRSNTFQGLYTPGKL